MNGFRLFTAELKSLFTKKKVLGSVIAVTLVPLVYVAILLSSKFGPYDNLDNLPVAVVNNDAGSESNGEPLNVGNDLVENLKANPTLKWDFVSEEEAQDGLDDMKYYMVIEIPEDFSANVTTVLDEEPKKAELNFIKNEGLHFMASQVTDSAIETIRTQLNAQVTESYVRTLFAQLGGVADGFQDAADGSNQIHDGALQLKDGTTQILDSLNEKAPDIERLANGAGDLEAGTQQLLSSITSKSGDIKALSDGSKELAAGAEDLKSGAGEVLAGLKTAKGGSDQLLAGLQYKVLPGIDQLALGVDQAKKSVSDTMAGLSELNAGFQQYKVHPALANDEDFQKLLVIFQTSLNSSADKISQFDQLKVGVNQVKSGLAEGSEFYNGLVAVNGGLGQLVAGQTKLEVGASDLVAGSQKISAGNVSVYQGWNQLSAGATELNNGASQINDGTQTVNEGWTTLTDGVTQVDEGLGELEAGSNELATGLTEGAESTSQLQEPSDSTVSMFASPVVLNGEIINDFEFYRDSTVPYIMSLALFAGIVAMSFIVNFQKPVLLPSSGASWFTGKLMNLSIFAVAQAVLISVYALVFLQIHVESGLLFILFSIIASLTFLMIVFFLVALAGNLGKFIALALIVLQLSTTGNSLPIVMLPDNIQSISAFLPLTYSIDGFRSIVSLGDFSNVWANVGVLLIFLGVSAVLTIVVFMAKFKSSRFHTTPVSIEEAV